MAIVNRTLDSSEQIRPLTILKEIEMTNGETGPLCHIPYPCVLKAVQLAAFDVNAGNLLLSIQRFIVGSGYTNIVLGSTFVPNSFGTSGVLTSGVSLPASGSTLRILLANDVLSYQVGGGASAMIGKTVGVVAIQPIQDLKVYLGGLA